MPEIVGQRITLRLPSREQNPWTEELGRQLQGERSPFEFLGHRITVEITSTVVVDKGRALLLTMREVR